MEDSVKIDVHRLMYSDESDGGEDDGSHGTPAADNQQGFSRPSKPQFVENEEEVNNNSSSEESDFDDREDVEKRQLSYPPLPVYKSPTPSHAKERLGLLTPTEELSEGEAGVPSGVRQSSRLSSASPPAREKSGESVRSQLRQERRVSFNPPLIDLEIDTPNDQLLPEGDTHHDHDPLPHPHEDDLLPDPDEDNEIEDLIRLQSRQELVLDWQEKHLHRVSNQDEFREILDSSEMDSSTIMKSIRSIPPSNFSTMVQEMTNSLKTLRSQLSTLNTISLFGDRLRELQPYEYNLDLLPLIKKLCTLIGESRSPESAVTLAKLIRGAGPTLVTDDLIYIIQSNNMKRKPAAIDGLTYGLLTFPRDDFDIEKVAEAVSRCLWNTKRRIRQAAIECLSVVAHVLGPGIAMPFLRELIEQHRPTATFGSPSTAISARVSRRLLPSPSPMGLIDYGLVLPSKQLSKAYLEQFESGGGGLEPILGKGDYGADVLWILHGASSGQSESNTDRSSCDSRGRGKSSKLGSETRSGHRQHEEFLHQKRLDSLVYDKDELLEEKLAEYKLHELERNYERSLQEVDHFDPKDEFVGVKTSTRDRDSGVSSLKSVRVASPTDSSSSKSPLPDVDLDVVPIFINATSAPSISSQSDEHELPFVMSRPVMARSSISTLTSQPGRTHQSRSPLEVPRLNSSNTVGSSTLHLEPPNWLKKSCPTKIPPARKAKSMSRAMGGRVIPSHSNTQVFPGTSRDTAKQTLSQALGQLSSPEWEINVDGFVSLTRLLRQQPELVKSELTIINRAALLHLTNLRTQVARSACLFFEDLFVTIGKPMEQDCEKIAEKLLDKAADTNKFIRDGSMGALEAMVKHLAPSKSLVPLENYGAKHRNSVVRATTAYVIRVLVEQVGPERILHQNPNKVLPMLIKFLQEGSLETRTHAKLALASLVVHGSFDTTLKRHIPSNTLKNVEKIISSIKNDLIRKG